MADIPRLPRPVTEVWEWQIRGACRDMDSKLFFHPDGARGPTRTISEVGRTRSARPARSSRPAATTRYRSRNRTAYGANRRGVGDRPVPQRPRTDPSVVVVPAVGISRLTEESLSAALSMGDRVVVVHVPPGTETEDRAAAPTCSGAGRNGDPTKRWYCC